MSLPFKPHTWAARLPDQDAPSGFGSPQTVRGQITPMMPVEAETRFGVPVGDIRRPHLLMCDAGDAAAHKEGGRVSWQGREFSITVPPQTFESIGAADHASVLLEELVEE